MPEKGFQHWCTPPEIVNRVHEVFGCAPSLDPFSNSASITRARVQWHGPDAPDPHKGCGFTGGWWGHVFFNPPFRHGGRAIAKAHAEHDAGHTDSIIGIFKTSMNSRHWWMVEAASSYCYMNRRTPFISHAGGEPVSGNRHDIAMAYWGPWPRTFVEAFADIARFPPAAGGVYPRAVGQ